MKGCDVSGAFPQINPLANIVVSYTENTDFTRGKTLLSTTDKLIKKHPLLLQKKNVRKMTGLVVYISQ